MTEMTRSAEKTGRGPSYHWLVLGTVCLGTFMAGLDSSIVNVTLPALSRFFGVDIPTIGWVAIGYQLAMTSALCAFGRLADLFGRRRIYVGGFAVFVLGSALSGASGGILPLVAFRVIQGIGAAMLMANSMALITEEFPGNQRGMAIGFLETSVAAAFTVAPTIGGFLQTWLGWRAVFYVNLPIGIIGAILGQRVLRDDRGDHADASFDWPGATLLGLGLTGILVALTRGAGSPGGESASTDLEGWLALPGALLLVGFAVVELRTVSPTIDLRLFRDRVFAGANLAKVFGYLSLSSVTFLMPFYLERVLHFNPEQIGLGMTAYPVALAVGSMVGGPLSDRVGSHVLAPIGLAIAGIGAGTLTRVTPAGGYLVVMIALLILGIGMGLFIVPNDSAIMGAAPRDRLGVAGGILATTRNLGLMSGVAFAGTFVSLRMVAHGISQPSGADPFLASFHDVYVVVIGICALAIVTSLFRGKAYHGS